MVDVDMDRLEVERVMNLVQGFGWEKTEEKIDDVYQTITIRKQRLQPAPEAGAGPS